MTVRFIPAPLVLPVEATRCSRLPGGPRTGAGYPAGRVFESLTSRLSTVFDRLRSRGRLSEADVDAALREVRLALLEADVNVAVTRSFLERVRARAVGAEVTGSLTPGQQ